MEKLLCISKEKAEGKKIALQTLLIFFYIFDIRPLAFTELLSSTKIIQLLIIFVIPAIRTGGKVYFKADSRFKELDNLLVSGVAIIGLTLFLSRIYHISEAPSFVPNSIYFVLNIAIGVRYLQEYFDTTEEFMKAIVIAMLIQSIIVICQYCFLPVREFLYNNFPYSGNKSYLYGVRASGLCLAEANGSVTLFLGIVANAYLMTSRKKITVFSITAYIINIIAIFLVGRTGLLCAVILSVFLFIWFASHIQIGKILKGVIFGTVGLAVLIMIMSSKSAYYETTMNWALRFFSEGLEESSVSSVLTAQHLQFNLSNLIGTSYSRGYLNSTKYYLSDLGYYRVFFALGIIPGFLYYCVIYYNSFKISTRNKNKVLKYYLLITLALLMFIEYKQMFVFTYKVLIFLFLAAQIERKTETYE